MINSAKSKLVNHKLKMQERQRNRFKPTCAACYRSKTPIDQDFLSLIFLFVFYFSFPIFLMVLAEILERKKRGKEEKKEKNMVGSQVLAIKVIFDQDLSSILIFHFTKISFIFFSCWSTFREKKERRKFQNLS